LGTKEPSGADSPNRFARRRRQSRDALIAAAYALFEEKGIRATRLEEICERADVSPRTFFNHFESREHLYRELAEERAGQAALLFDRISENDKPFSAQLGSLFFQLGRYLEARPAYRELVGEMLNLHVDGGSEVVRTRLLGRAALDFVAAADARGEITRRHPPEVLADILLGALMTALANWSADADYALEQELGRSAAALIDLFAGRPAEA